MILNNKLLEKPSKYKWTKIPNFRLHSIVMSFIMEEESVYRQLYQEKLKIQKANKK